MLRRWVALALLLMVALPASRAAAQGVQSGGAVRTNLPGESAGVPTEQGDFAPLPDRWRIEPPPYQLNVKGHWWDPYNQNVLKGDYPIFGQDVFMRLTGASKTLLEGKSAPTPSGVSAKNPGSFTFFGNDDAIIFDQKLIGRIDLQKGATSYRPFDWQATVEGVYDVNHLSVYENGVVNPNPGEGTDRTVSDAALQEASFELHLMNLSDNYDFVSTKVGRQPFNSDFRSLIFSDTNQGARIFGTANNNRYQYNLLYFYQAEKDTNSELNSFRLRDQQVAVANLYIQDFLTLGYTTQFSFHYNRDDGKESGFTFDRQGFLVRPDPVGIAKPHNLDVYYLGWTSDGHIGFLNVSHALYQALGHDTDNPIAGRPVGINGQLGFLELSVDHDWQRYQTSVFVTSGDDNPRNGTARGFDSIMDFPEILGGEASYWHRQSVRIADRGGVALMQRDSVIPDLRSSKIQGQSEFVNPGILIVNAQASFDLTPKLRALGNINYIRFMDTEPLEILLKQPNIRKDVGIDIGALVEYRPLLNNNIILKGYAAVLQPIGGFQDIYSGATLFQAGTEVALVF